MNINGSGIYAIINIVNDKHYVGSAKNLKNRKHDHFRKLKYRTHSNNHLQAAYDKVGINNLIFVILENCTNVDLVSHEQYWINKLDVVNAGYNQRPTAHNQIGYKHTDETIQKLKNRKYTEESIKKFSEAKKGKKATKDTKEKMSNSQKQRGARSVEVKDNMKKAWLKRKNFPEIINPIILGNS